LNRGATNPLDLINMKNKKDSAKARPRRAISILRHGIITTYPSSRFAPRSRTKYYCRYIKTKL